MLPKIFKRMEFFDAIQFLFDWWICEDSLLPDDKFVPFLLFGSCLFTFLVAFIVNILLLYVKSSLIYISSDLITCSA